MGIGTRRWYSLLILAILLWLLVLLGVMWLETRPVTAEGHVRVAEDGPPLTVLLVGDYEHPAVEVPVEFAVQALPVFACDGVVLWERRGWRDWSCGR